MPTNMPFFGFFLICLFVIFFGAEYLRTLELDSFFMLSDFLAFLFTYSYWICVIDGTNISQRTICNNPCVKQNQKIEKIQKQDSRINTACPWSEFTNTCITCLYSHLLRYWSWICQMFFDISALLIFVAKLRY